MNLSVNSISPSSEGSGLKTNSSKEPNNLFSGILSRAQESITPSKNADKKNVNTISKPSENQSNASSPPNSASNVDNKSSSLNAAPNDTQPPSEKDSDPSENGLYDLFPTTLVLPYIPLSSYQDTPNELNLDISSDAQRSYDTLTPISFVSVDRSILYTSDSTDITSTRINNDLNTESLSPQSIVALNSIPNTMTNSQNLSPSTLLTATSQIALERTPLTDPLAPNNTDVFNKGDAQMHAEALNFTFDPTNPVTDLTSFSHRDSNTNSGFRHSDVPFLESSDSEILSDHGSLLLGLPGIGASSSSLPTAISSGITSLNPQQQQQFNTFIQDTITTPLHQQLGRNYETVLHLNPNQLGSASIQIQWDSIDQTANIHIVVEQSHALTAVEQAIQGLKESLSQQGIKVAEIKTTLDPQAGQFSFEQQSQHGTRHEFLQRHAPAFISQDSNPPPPNNPTGTTPPQNSEAKVNSVHINVTI